MYAASRLRYKEVVESIQRLLRDMAIDARAFPGVVQEIRVQSSASAPSLRSRESQVVPMISNAPENGGANVRVVVRVRGFLPRGM